MSVSNFMSMPMQYYY